MTLTLHQNFTIFARNYIIHFRYKICYTFWVNLNFTKLMKTKAIPDTCQCIFFQINIVKDVFKHFWSNILHQVTLKLSNPSSNKKRRWDKNMNSNLTLSSNTTPKLCGTCFKTNFSSMAHTIAILCCIKCQINLIMGMKQPQFLCNK